MERELALQFGSWLSTCFPEPQLPICPLGIIDLAPPLFQALLEAQAGEQYKCSVNFKSIIGPVASLP